jgi:hypothetical protein
MKNRKHQRSQFLPWFGLITLFYCLLMVVTWHLSGYDYGLDASWSIALHVALANGMQFGKDFIYTYGPYGILINNIYFPDTFIYLICGRLLTGLALWAGLFSIMRLCLSRGDFSIVFVLPFLGFFPNTGLLMDSFYLLVAVLPLIVYFYGSDRRRSSFLILTLLGAALVSLVKHSFLIPSAICIGLITVDELFRRRRLPLVFPVYAIALISFWLLAKQDLANFPSYIFNGLEIAKGFGATMGISGPVGEIVLYLISTGLFFLLVVKTEWQDRRWRGLLPAVGLGIVLYITFKGAFVRHDAHALQATLNTMPIILIFTAVLWSKLDTNRFAWAIGNKKFSAKILYGVALFANLLMGSLILHHYFNYGYGTYFLNAWKWGSANTAQAIKLISGQVNFQELLDNSAESIRVQNPLPDINAKTVDLYPNDVAVVFAHDLPYHPRPIFQSFSAYTSKLAQLNATHLKENGAETILFDIQPIDGRLPSSEDGLSWSELLTRYDIKDIEGRYLVLQRNPQPRDYSFEPIKELTIPMGEWIDLPDIQAAPIWVEIDSKPGILGKLASTAFKVPALYMEVETNDGLHTTYRVLADVMDTGFLLSPMLSDRWDFLALATPDWQTRLSSRSVKRMRLVSPGIASLVYPSSYRMTLKQLQFPRQDFSKVVGWQEWEQNLLNTGTAVKPINGTLQKVPLSNSTWGWMAHAPMRISVELAEPATSFFASFGILDGAWQEGRTTDGVEFRIIAVKSDGREEVIFSRQLQPLVNTKDRGLQQVSINLTEIDAKKIILETLPGETSAWDWSFWSDIRAK